MEIEERLDVGIVGAGPVGLEAAVRAGRLGLAARVWDRGPLCASILDYPVNLVFFTSNELLEVGDHPLVSGGAKATRKEALDYYRRVAEVERLDVVTHAEVRRVVAEDGGFLVGIRAAGGEREERVRALVVATGYYTSPRRLGVPGEDLPHVSHYYREAHPQWRRRVVVVGAGNSAAEAALEMHRAGARVTILHRGGAVKDTVKYWVRPDLENRIREGSIAAVFGATVTSIDPQAVHYEVGGKYAECAADAVFLLTGFIADSALAGGAGAALRQDGSVVLATDSSETSVAGLYVVGSAGFGPRTGEVFIENGRLHARAAVEHIARRLGRT